MPRPRIVRIPPYRWPGRLRARLVRARPGSVLILVVAVLVLLALIATAWITTVRIDRQAVARNNDNTEFDLLVDGVVNAESAALVRRLVADGRFRPDGYPHVDGLGDGPLADPNLADRVPLAGGSTPYWPRISASPFGPNDAGQFDSPRGGDFPYDFRTNVAPTYVMLPTGSGGSKAFPALRLPKGRVVLAADADGDGIADAGLFRLPVGPTNGLTYYGAVRTVDNGSALNANVATKPLTRGEVDEFVKAIPGSAPALLGSFFPTNISLYDLLQIPDAELQHLVAHRYTGASDQGLSLVDAWKLFGNGADAGAGVRSDMVFTSPYEAMYSQLAARLGNPGLHAPVPGGSGPQAYRPFSLSDSLAFAFHFCLADRDASMSPLEACLMNSTRSAFSVRSPYRPDEATTWFNEQFNYDGGGPIPLRPLLVTRNPVSTFAPDRFFDRGSGYVRAQAYYVGDRVYDPGTRRSFVCIRDISVDEDIPPDLIIASRAQAYWAVQPWTSHPTKISVNSGTFGQLFGAYWSVMGGAPFVANREPSRDALDTWQFKSNVRVGSPVPGNVPLTGRQMRQIRAALAAVNTMDLRDADDTVTSRTIGLTGPDGKPKYTVDVFGLERQPFITEVLVDYNPTAPGGQRDYEAVELYNPHAVPISLAGVQLVACSHDSAKLFPPLADLTSLGSISPGERILVEHGTRPSEVDNEINDDRRHPGVTIRTLQGALSQLTNKAFGQYRELYLIRTRSPAGKPARGDTPADHYDESFTSNRVPLDQVDFTNVTIPPPNLDPSSDPRQRCRWRYARVTRPTNDPKSNCVWYCVYPGMYRFAPPVSLSVYAQHRSMRFTRYDPTQEPSDAESRAGLGAYKIRAIGPEFAVSGAGTFRDISRPLQLAAIDAAGPNAGTGLFPYGGFARNGDILQVPFIGSYTIRPSNATSLDTFSDMVSVTLDSVYAEDGDYDFAAGRLGGAFDPRVSPPDPSTIPPSALPGDDFVTTTSGRLPFENIGRFVPLSYLPGQFTYYDDFAPLPLDTTDPKLVYQDQLGRWFSTKWRYHFALDLFDYLDVRSPQDDYLPNVDPGDPLSGRVGGIAPGQTPDPVNNGPGVLANDGNKGREDAAGEEGKVNINTASWRVLAAVPMLTDTAGNIVQPDNTTLAKRIVDYRDVDDGSGPPGRKVPHGPFRSVFELLKVPGFQQSIHGLSDIPNVYVVEVDDADGDFSPYNGNPAVGRGPPETDGVDHVFSDFKAEYLALTRISNLLTTRSDSFTVYVLVQAWRNAGTDHPELVGQRRIAFYADRASVRPLPPPAPNVHSSSLTPMNIVTMPNN